MSTTTTTTTRPVPTLRRAAAELLGTAALLTSVVGSAIMAARLSGGNDAVALLANSAATGLALAVIILALGPISGAHLNPVISVVEAVRGRIEKSEAAVFTVAQTVGAFAGVALADAMFELPPYALSDHARSGAGTVLGEAVATFGLVVVVCAVAKTTREAAVPFVVGAYIAAGYWFTSSMSFANPAVTFARAFTDTPAGIRLGDVPGFLAGQIAGAVLAMVAVRFFVDVDADPERR